MRVWLGCLLALVFSCAHAQVNPGTSPLTVPKGGTGAATASAARNNLGVPGIPVSLANGGLGGSQAAATANQISVYPGGGGAAVPKDVGGSGGLFDSICSSTVGQFWVRMSSGWGCTALGYANPVWWGAKADGTIVTATLSITSGNTALTATGATFTSGDVGKAIGIPGAGAAGAYLTTTIATFVDATHITIGTTAGSTLAAVSGQITYGTDNTSAINSAHATGLVVNYPNGTLVFNTLNTVASGGIVGQGRSGTVLASIDGTTNSAFVFNSSASVPIFRNFQLLGPSTTSGAPIKSNGAGIQLAPASGEISRALIENVTVAFFPVDYDFVAASYLKVLASEALGYSVAGFQVANTNNTDSGDSFIGAGTVISTNGASGVGILQKSSGGLKINGVKINGGNVGYGLQFNGSANTSDILISNTSIENTASQCVSLARTSGVSNFSNITIDIQCAISPTGVQSDASAFINELKITGLYNLASGTGSCVNIATVTNFSIGPLTCKGNGGTPTGVVIAASNSNGKVSANTYSGIATGNTLQNSSTTTFVHKDTQQGASTTASAGWSAYGTLFSSPTTSVTFATPFTVSPTAQDIILTPGSTNGITGAIVTAVSTTGFSYMAISATNNIAATVEWKASGTY